MNANNNPSENNPYTNELKRLFNETKRQPEPIDVRIMNFARAVDEWSKEVERLSKPAD